VDGGEETIYYDLLALTVRSLSPKMLALRVLEPDTIDIDGCRKRSSARR
jgi:hypothetical protein